MRQTIVTEAFRYSDGEVGEERDKQEGRGKGGETGASEGGKTRLDGESAGQSDKQKERHVWLIAEGKTTEQRGKGSTCCTFSLSSEYESPQGGDYLKLVVTQSSHLPDSAGQNHPFGVHLLNRGGHTHTANK